MPAEIKNLKKAAQRILKAVKKKERIILYGDSDLDGVASVIILEESIKNLGGKIEAVYFPDQEVEGHGISRIGLNYLKNKTPALLIAVDCGIGNFKEIKLAKKLGFEIIIVDHHQILDKLPEADIIVNPKQKGDRYPFKGLSATGIVFKLSELLLNPARAGAKNKMAESLKRSFLELTALATLADMMPRESENKFFIEEGLTSLKKSWRPGIKALFEAEPFKGYLNINQKVFKIISILNVRSIKNRLPASFRLLTASSSEEIKAIIKKLLALAEAKKEKIEKITRQIEKNIFVKTEPIIFKGGSSFDLAAISSAASIICHQYCKPTFVFKKMAQESQGTVRVPSGIDSVSLMKKCSRFLLAYGGHAQASGFRIKNENLAKFKQCLIFNIKQER